MLRNLMNHVLNMQTKKIKIHTHTHIQHKKNNGIVN